MAQDYYKVIGVTPGASEEEIKSAYRRMAKKYHPDAHPGDEGCERRFREINEAYGVLGDPEKRKKYDTDNSRPRAGAARSGSAGSGADNQDIYQNIFRQFDSMFGFRSNEGDTSDQGKNGHRSENPLDTTAMFERFMGIKR